MSFDYPHFPSFDDFQTREEFEVEILRLRAEICNVVAECGELRAALNASQLNNDSVKAMVPTDFVAQIENLEARHNQMLSSISWRLGNALIKPLSIFKRLLRTR